MEKFLAMLRRKYHLVLSVPAVLCFITFITNLIQALKDGNIDSNELHGLLASADGFETVFLILVMVLLKDKKK